MGNYSIVTSYYPAGIGSFGVEKVSFVYASEFPKGMRPVRWYKYNASNVFGIIKERTGKTLSYNFYANALVDSTASTMTSTEKEKYLDKFGDQLDVGAKYGIDFKREKIIIKDGKIVDDDDWSFLLPETDHFGSILYTNGPDEKIMSTYSACGVAARLALLKKAEHSFVKISLPRIKAFGARVAIALVERSNGLKHIELSNSTLEREFDSGIDGEILDDLNALKGIREMSTQVKDKDGVVEADEEAKGDMVSFTELMDKGLEYYKKIMKDNNIVYIDVDMDFNIKEILPGDLEFDCAYLSKYIYEEETSEPEDNIFLGIDLICAEGADYLLDASAREKVASMLATAINVDIEVTFATKGDLEIGKAH